MSKYPDISHHHPVSDWDAVKKNCPFLISKATEGRTYVDPTLHSFIEGCEAKGIPYWLFTYLRYGNEVDQAQFLVETCKDLVGPYFVGYILDVEEGNRPERVQRALNYINGLGCKTMIYTMYAQYNSYKDVLKNFPEHCAWWEARHGLDNGVYSAEYPPHDGVHLHQYTSTGTCQGITGKCDLNRIVQKGEDWYRTPVGGLTENAAGESDSATEGSVVGLGTRTLSRGSTGESVSFLQNLLKEAGYYTGAIDGIFGKETLKAVLAFQVDHNLDFDGVVGKKTRAALTAL